MTPSDLKFIPRSVIAVGPGDWPVRGVNEQMHSMLED